MLRNFHHACGPIKFSTNFTQFLQAFDVVLFDVGDTLNNICERVSMGGQGKSHL